ncbi:uncharacterized protein BP5553_06523 [Venustampulla echinocandica]|uniref:Aflatoxin regulatory protein domain-containing protein n=1 Tax=Venustampulla echinocandica TaxID=2656787 RepID=A0A370TK57_9HELO|nr:uncharacterized protein BP5553_06523 [Venustampulla echinocandica]RDL35911.1 hypothetical protein BP5553_06523 [Venustampulla echinocandica]
MLCSDQDVISRPYSTKRTFPRSITVRTHVSGMKSLLPLKLSPVSSPEFGFPPARNSLERSTPNSRNSCHKSKPFSAIVNVTNQAHRFPRLPLNVTSESYRDVPVYIDARSPLPGPVYYPTSSFWLDWSDSVSSSDEDWDAECMSQKFEMSQPDSLRCGSMGIFGGAQHPVKSEYISISADEAKTRDSELSFQCLGEKFHPDEATWLSTPAYPGLSEHLPEILAQSMPPQRDVRSWLSETDSMSDSEDSEDSDLDSEAESAPAIAAAVDVNAAHASGRLVKIPPRSSSLTSTGSVILDHHDDETCFAESHDDEHRSPLDAEDLETRGHYRPGTPFPRLHRIEEDGMESWPFSPPPHQTSQGVPQAEMSRFPEDMLTPSHKSLNLRVPRQPLISVSHSMNEILSILGKSNLDLRSSLLRDYSPCVAALRSHLHPILTVDARYRPASIQSTSSQNQHRRTAVRLSPFATVSPCTNTPVAPHLPEGFGDFDSYDACSPPLDLAPLHRIFPSATTAMVLALYTHILAFIFLAQSRSPNPSVSPPASTIRSSAVSSISTSTPSKSASKLGIAAPLDDANTREDLISNLTSACQLEDLAEHLRHYINRLTRIMRLGSYNDYDGDDNDDIPEDHANECFMQALVEVVTNCELQTMRS